MTKNLIPLKKARKISEKKTQKTFNDLRDQLITIKKEIDWKIEKVDNKIDDSKTKVIETLGIFVALFTFVSIEFQAFSRAVRFQEIAGLSLIMLGSLLFFIIVLDFVLNIPLMLNTYKRIPGFTDSIIKNSFLGYDKKIDLNIFKPETWNTSFILRTILMILCLTIIFIGIILLSIDKKEVKIDKAKENNQKEIINSAMPISSESAKITETLKN